MTTIVEIAPEPSAADLDDVITRLKNSWTAKITMRRQSRVDAGIKSIYVSLDGERIARLSVDQEVTCDVKPGPHTLRVHNTLFWRTISFTIGVGEHASFMTANRECSLTFSMWAYVLGTNIVYLTFDREELS
ncbi:MAG: hypothetical protein FJW27_16010 [Acidimicrobiia bacterium]|nr:hypothetical protein [Acidimicrobiia bacterium]